MINIFGIPFGQPVRRQTIVDVTYEDLSDTPPIEGALVVMDIEAEDDSDQHRWIEDLKWCPSQIYYNFVEKGVPIQLYLRWRHQDPWTAELYICTNEDFYEWKERIEEFQINRFFRSDEYKELEKHCLEILRKSFPNTEFKDPE